MLEQPLLFNGCSCIQFFNLPPFPEHSQLDHTWWPPPHRAAFVVIMGRYATPLVTGASHPTIAYRSRGFP